MKLLVKIFKSVNPMDTAQHSSKNVLPGSRTGSAVKSLSFTLVILLLTGAILTAQALQPTPAAQASKKSSAKLNSRRGYITMNDLTYAFGLSATDAPYSKSYLGFNTVHGYQLNKNFVIAAGSGLFVYEDGKTVPLFLDVIYRFHNGTSYTSYAFADGGFLFRINETANETQLFINPGIGVRHDFSRDLGMNFGVGLMIQQAEIRSSFINLKIGLTFKP